MVVEGWAVVIGDKRARLGMGYVPQRENVFESMTVLENLEIGAAAARGGVPRGRVEELLALLPGPQGA